MARVRAAAKAYNDILDAELPDGPDKTFVIRAHRSNAMWANVAITRLRMELHGTRRMKFDWASLFSKLAYIPVIVAGIQAIHGEAKSGGADKKQMAMDALGLCPPQTAAAVDPGDQAMIQASSNAASTLIDTVVAGFKADGVHGFTPSSSAPPA